MRASLKEKALAFTCSREFQNLGACVLIVSWTCLLPENISEMDSQIQLTRVSWGWSPTAQVLVSSSSELKQAIHSLSLRAVHSRKSKFPLSRESFQPERNHLAFGLRCNCPEKEERSQAAREFWKSQGPPCADDGIWQDWIQVGFQFSWNHYRKKRAVWEYKGYGNL